MKHIFFVFLIGSLFLFFFVNSSAQCYYTTTTTIATSFVIKSKVSYAKLKDIKWSSFSIYEELLPGASSYGYNIYDYNFGENTSFEGIIRFTMVVNGSSIYLETVDSYKISKGESKVFVIDDNTRVRNPLLESSISSVLKYQ